MRDISTHPSNSATSTQIYSIVATSFIEQRDFPGTAHTQRGGI